MARATYLPSLGLFLLLSCSVLGGTLDPVRISDLAVQVDDPRIWRGLLASVGIEPTTNPARFRIVVGTTRPPSDQGSDLLTGPCRLRVLSTSGHRN